MHLVTKSGRIPVGLLGFGYWGPNLLRNLTLHGGFEPVGVVDGRPAARERAQSMYPHIPVYETLERFLNEAKASAMVIATPPKSHRALAIQCLEKGLDVLIEKPMATSIEDCDAILAVARQHKRKLMVDHTYVYHPGVQFLSDSIQNGLIGEPLYYNSTRANLGKFQTGLGALWDLAPHDLSILDLLMAGKLPETVSAVASNHYEMFDETLCYVHLTYENNFTAHLHLSWVAPLKLRMVILGGTEKMIIFDENMPAEPVKVYDRAVSIGDASLSEEVRISYRSGNIVSPALSLRESLASLIGAFHSFVTRGEQPISDGESGKRIVQILEAANRSIAQKGIPIDVEPSRPNLGRKRTARGGR